ncbi:hypothetical protein FQR65_LT08309 [Abscondita terminalis]|nr:hypothetical protein FQR65_LT08309 [Abscondita terminalis]
MPDSWLIAVANLWNDFITKSNLVSQLSILRGPTITLNAKQIHRMFEETATKNPFQIAILFDDCEITRKYTYLEVDNLSNSLAKVVRQNIVDYGIPRNGDGDFIVAVFMYPSDYLVITLLSIWKSGAAYLPIDPAYPQSRINHIIKEAQPALVICDEDRDDLGDTFKISRHAFFEAARKFSNTTLNDNETLNNVKSDMAVLLYTSGTTAYPKGVRISHKMLMNRLQWQFNTFPYSKTEQFSILKTALTFVDSISEIWGPLLNALTVLVVPKPVTQNPEQLVNVLEKYKIERLILVPSLLRSLLMYFTLHVKKIFLLNLKTWMCSGETLPVLLVKEFYNYFPADRHRLCNFYGSTEITDVTYHVVTNPEEINSNDKIPIGLPVDNTIIYILDSQLRPVQKGEVGELFVAGANVPDGYVNGRDSNKFSYNSFTRDSDYMKLYRTGDFARVVGGTIMYEGRTDSQIKVRGYRFDLQEIEKVINSIDKVKQTIVLCYKPETVNQSVVAFVIAESPLNTFQIEMVLKSSLPSYMIPHVILIDVIPLLVNGKTDRQALLKYYKTLKGRVIDYNGVPEEQKEVAKVLFETIASVLNKSAEKLICFDANFYEIGGNSLNSIYVIICLKDRGYYISVSDFITAVNLGEVLDRISTKKPMLFTQKLCYTTEFFCDEQKNDVIDIITSSFYNEKSDLERWILTEVTDSDYQILLEIIWSDLVDQQLSFIVRRKTGKYVGVSLIFDGRDKPIIETNSRIMVGFEFVERIEEIVMEKLPKEKGKILYSCMMGTDSSLTPQENVAVIQFMEEEVIQLAKRKNFAGVLTTNTNPLTQHLCSNFYGYETCLDYQVNQFVASDNTKPFGLAPDSQRALVQWKEV